MWPRDDGPETLKSKKKQTGARAKRVGRKVLVHSANRIKQITKMCESESYGKALGGAKAGRTVAGELVQDNLNVLP